MNHIASDARVRYENSRHCVAFEYEFNDEKDINNAVIELTGRYPDSGYARNMICKEIVYVIEGSGQVATPDEKTPLATGDMLRINALERYYFDGHMKLLVASSPAWFPQQYETTES